MLVKINFLKKITRILKYDKVFLFLQQNTYYDNIYKQILQFVFSNKIFPNRNLTQTLICSRLFELPYYCSNITTNFSIMLSKDKISAFFCSILFIVFCLLALIISAVHCRLPNNTGCIFRDLSLLTNKTSLYVILGKIFWGEF